MHRHVPKYMSIQCAAAVMPAVEQHSCEPANDHTTTSISWLGRGASIALYNHFERRRPRRLRTRLCEDKHVPRLACSSLGVFRELPGAIQKTQKDKRIPGQAGYELDLVRQQREHSHLLERKLWHRSLEQSLSGRWSVMSAILPLSTKPSMLFSSAASECHDRHGYSAH
jgi:hypothetical protein